MAMVGCMALLSCRSSWVLSSMVCVQGNQSGLADKFKNKLDI